jgi:hypothetical protein
VTTAIQLALRHVSLRRAFADFREAIRSPIDTGFFCYRTAETVMQHFRDRDTKRAGWDRMKDVLNIEEAALRWLQVQADAPRHGQVAPLPAKDQVRALTLVQQLLDRFALFLADAIGARGKFVEPIRLPDGKGDDSETH